MNKSVVCPIIVGRGDDLDLLRRLVRESSETHGQIALIAGAAGIGKSRLVSEALKTLAPGTEILRGNCFENDRAVPYAPLIDLLREFNASHDLNALSIHYGSTGPELVKLIPELAARLQVSPTAAMEAGQEKRRVFQALVEFLLERSRRPSIIVIEDLHWCDDISLEFLLHLARRIRTRPVLLVLTYRNDEVTPALEHFLAELDRGRLATELVLSPLSLAEVDSMLRAIFELGRPVRPEFLDVLYPLTEGNPFFLEETLKSLIADGDVFYADGAWDRKPVSELRVPRSVQDAVRRRLEKVSQEAREALNIAAAVGQRFEFALMLDLTGLGEEKLLKVLKELIGAQLITDESRERFAFRHALTREAIYSRLIERERVLLHQRIGETLERLHARDGDEQHGNLARHFYRAGVWARAMHYSELAGREALALYAPRAAIEQLTHAIEARQHLDLAPAADHHAARGRAFATLGDFESARADYETALQAAALAGDTMQEWQILLDLGMLWAGRDYSQTGSYYQRAYDLARATGDPLMLAHAHNRLGNWRVNAERPGEGLEHHARALQLFRELGDARGLAETFDLLGMANYIRGDLVSSEEYYDKAVALFREMNDRQALASSLASKMLNSSHLQAGMGPLAGTDRARALQDGEAALRIAREIGWRSGEAYALIMLADHSGVRGEYSRAFELSMASLAIAEEIEHIQWITYSHYVLGALYLDVLAAPEAIEHLESAAALARQIGSGWWTTNASGYLALAQLLAGNPGRAAGVLDAALQTSVESALAERRPFHAQTLGQRLSWYAAGELALAGGAPDAALHVADQLLTTLASTGAGGQVPRLMSLRGRALLALMRLDPAEADLLAARAAAQQEGEKPHLWRTWVALGTLYRLQGRHASSLGAFVEAQRLVEIMAQDIPDARLRRDFSARALESVPPMRRLSARQAAKQEAGGLTRREREVAGMISRGRSNREMAEALTVGERTIETHVSNILAKLGFSSRSQVAAWAVEKGLGAEKEA